MTSSATMTKLTIESEDDLDAKDEKFSGGHGNDDE